MPEVIDVADEVGGIRRREFRRILAASSLGHLALFAFLLVNPGQQLVMLPGVVTVELVAAPAGLAPAPRPKAPPKPVQKKVVLPAQPTTPKPHPQPVAEKAPPPKPVEEEDYSDVMAQLRADAGEDVPETVPSAMAGSGARTGQLVSPEVAAWLKKAKIHVRRAWVLPAAFRTQALEAHVAVNLDAGGNVVGKPNVVRGSGNPWYDDGVVRAIQKASPLPPPPAADEWSFVFVPGDSY